MTEDEPWGEVVLETIVRRCAYCDCAVCLESTGERSCSWCGARYVVRGGKPERTDGWGGVEPSQEGTGDA